MSARIRQLLADGEPRTVREIAFLLDVDDEQVEQALHAPAQGAVWVRCEFAAAGPPSHRTYTLEALTDAAVDEEALRESQAEHSRARILALLGAAAEPVSSGDINDALQLEGAANPLLQRMLARGLVEKHPGSRWTATASPPAPRPAVTSAELAEALVRLLVAGSPYSRGRLVQLATTEFAGRPLAEGALDEALAHLSSTGRLRADGRWWERVPALARRPRPAAPATLTQEVPMDTVRTRVQRLLLDGAPLTVTEMRTKLDCTPEAVRQALKQLEQEGRVEITGTIRQGAHTSSLWGAIQAAPPVAAEESPESPEEAATVTQAVDIERRLQDAEGMAREERETVELYERTLAELGRPADNDDPWEWLREELGSARAGRAELDRLLEKSGWSSVDEVLQQQRDLLHASTAWRAWAAPRDAESETLTDDDIRRIVSAKRDYAAKQAQHARDAAEALGIGTEDLAEAVRAHAVATPSATDLEAAELRGYQLAVRELLLGHSAPLQVQAAGLRRASV